MSNLIIDAFIEIPTGSQNKYEFDKSRGLFVLDRVLFSPMHYPVEYGYLPDTLASDGNTLGVLVITSYPTFPGCVIEARVVGAIIMSDEDGQEEKLLAVPVRDPRFKDVTLLDHIPEHKLKEISHFFQVYKDLEDKKTTIKGWENADFAAKLYEECADRYKEAQ
jgi:inorganic pyrophosphatase